MDKVLSRRSVLKGSALGLGAAIMGFAPLLDAAQKVSASASDSITNPMSDLDVLNYALTLEHLEYAFYRDGLNRFKFADLDNTGRPSEHLGRYLTLVRDHERIHVSTLTNAIRNVGGVPVPELKYKFGYTDIRGFLRIAMALENTGVMAYDGAVKLIKNPAYLTVAATIATVEARHASFLNLVNDAVPFPSAFDTPKTPAEIVAIAGQFIVS
ncbi:MAG: ferritin-like domain-containing protein [Anaerolineae bacterium]|nr:ferritin-like domain-containing protein [Anaerolineae bacterium]